MADIDIVLTWVDGSDPAWQAACAAARKAQGLDVPDFSARYRDWDNLKYLFRGIERFMPWVRTVHFVTWGHLPPWLNRGHKKLHIARHEDFMPPAYLPTFNSSVLELNLFRVPGLSEQYINFNDDMFVIRPTAPEDFFVDGLPCDTACLSPQPIFRSVICNTELNNLEILNDHFTVADIMRHKDKWFSPKYGSLNVRTALFSKFPTILGVYQPHIPFSYLRSTAEEVWRQEQAELDAACRHPFRSKEDYSEWLFRSWQLLSGRFVPRSPKIGAYTRAYAYDSVRQVLFHGKEKLVCINDTDGVTDFAQAKQTINGYLQQLLPQKSAFEI